VYVYFNPKVVEHKKLPAISEKEMISAFTRDDLRVYTNSDELFQEIENRGYDNHVLLMMSSGNFDGKDLLKFAGKICNQ
jgi:UDP-N-acetylmuramate: L-alanyl-gamma-D-glutamyl-meso-diaminopimelate ligase